MWNIGFYLYSVLDKQAGTISVRYVYNYGHHTFNCWNYANGTKQVGNTKHTNTKICVCVFIIAHVWAHTVEPDWLNREKNRIRLYDKWTANRSDIRAHCFTKANEWQFIKLNIIHWISRFEWPVLANTDLNMIITNSIATILLLLLAQML